MSEGVLEPVNTDQYISGIRQIVWGLVIVLLDIRINGFDILPDVIGYFSVISGLGRLRPLNGHFSRSRKFAIWLMLLAIPSLYEPSSVNLFSFKYTSLTVIMMLMSVVSNILNLFMIYHVCLGVAEVASSKEETAYFALEARGRWRNYLYLNSAFLAFQPFILNLSEQAVLVSMFIAIPFMLIVEILIIILIYRFGKKVITVPGSHET